MKKCSHFAVGRLAQRDIICRLPAVYDYCCSAAKIYWVGSGEPPVEEKIKILRKFKQFPFCPKCGEKLEFPL